MRFSWTFSAALLAALASTAVSAEPEGLQAGFAERDISPILGGKPVYMAGFGQNRKATAVHDPLFARAVVLKHGGRKLALVSLDLVGFFRPNVLRVRAALSGFDHVLVSSTHNHEGPDTLGLWGPNPFTSGVDPQYMKRVETETVAAVRAAEAAAVPTTAAIGTAHGPELLHDGREPQLKHDELVALLFRDAAGKPSGLLVQWNCHPETLDDKNTQVSADYVGYTVAHLRKRYGCPVAYFTGTVGGLMTSLHVDIKDAAGKPLADGTFAKTERFGVRVGELAERAVAAAKPVALGSFRVRTRVFYAPMDNKLYQAGRLLGVLDREAFLWSDDRYRAEPAPPREAQKRLAIQSEASLLRLGDLAIAAIPGEIYPELVLGKVQDPPDPGADFPEAPVEPSVFSLLKAPHRMVIGLAADEIGYVIPKRQWDEKPPFCYGRRKSQYGEVNSVGPETAPILMRVLSDLAADW